MKYALIATHWDILEDTYILAKEIANYMNVILLIDKEQDTRWFNKILCKNYGYDMGKYKYYFENHVIDKNDEYLLINNTISPIGSLWALFRFIEQSELPFLCATDAYTSSKKQKKINGWYAQSYFIYLRGKALSVFNDYMLKTNIKNDKWYIIDKFEFGLSRLIKKKGIKIDVYLPVKRMMEKYQEVRYNPFIYHKTNGRVIVKEENGEWNGLFIRPDIYIEEWLPFVKNTTYSNWFTAPLVQLLANKLYYGSQTKTFWGI